MSALLSPEEYMTLLLKRRAEHEANNPSRSWWARALPEWFVRTGDEHLIDMAAIKAATPTERPTPTTPRTYRPASHWRAQRDAVRAELDALNGQGGDTAVVNLSPTARSRAAASAGRRRMARLDRDLQHGAALTGRLRVLDDRVARAEAREATS